MLGSKEFSVKSLYSSIKNDTVKVPYKFLWKIKLPQKIKFSFGSYFGQSKSLKKRLGGCARLRFLWN
jgi:hypothetical protein